MIRSPPFCFAQPVALCAAEAIYGRPANEAHGSPISELVGAAVDPVAIVTSGGAVQCTHRSADGTLLDVRVSAAAMENGYVFVCCDLTALHRAEQQFEAIVASMVEGVIAQLRLELDTPATIGATSLPIGASIGVVEVHPGDVRTADEILRDADLAMYEAKRARRSRGA